MEFIFAPLYAEYTCFEKKLVPTQNLTILAYTVPIYRFENKSFFLEISQVSQLVDEKNNF